MLTALFDLFKFSTKNNTIKPRPLRMSTEYKYKATTNTFFSNVPPEVTTVFKNAAQLPIMSDAKLSICEIDSSARLVGFNKPKKICGHVIVYPEETLINNRKKLFEVAQKNGMNVGVFRLDKDQKCIQVAKNGKTYFLVNPESLRLRGKWSYLANPVVASSAPTIRPR